MGINSKLKLVSNNISNKKPVLKAVPVILVFIAVMVVLLLDGSICVFKSITGLPCPGCGMTRAYLSLLGLDIKAAFFYHPLFPLPAFILLLFAFKNKSGRINAIYRSNSLWLVLLFATLAVWAVRMLLLFPATAPMDLNRNAVLQRIISALF